MFHAPVRKGFKAEPVLLLNPNAYRLLIRPLLFRLPPESAQSLAEFALKRRIFWGSLSPALRVRDPWLTTTLCGIDLENPIGLAAGFDKNCEVLPSAAALGFGYVIGGTVTLEPKPGNARPRVLRNVKEESLVNALGFPNRGLEFAARRLEREQGDFGATKVMVSVSGTTVEEMVACHRRLEPLVHAIELNISSPNTAGLRIFQEPDALRDLLGRVGDARKRPLFVKLPPYAADDETDDRDRVLGLVRVCLREGVDGVTVANTRPVQDGRLAVGTGGQSGRPIFGDMVRMVAEVKGEVGDRMAINASGGVFSGEDAWRALRAGATTVQLLTGLIYRGPGLVKQVNRELLQIMARESATLSDGPDRT